MIGVRDSRFIYELCVPFFLGGKSCARREPAKKLELDCVRGLY